MTVTSVHKDPATRTMTLTAHYDAPPGKVWLLWADPRRLERWWGPPTHPATVVDHDLTPAARSRTTCPARRATAARAGGTSGPSTSPARWNSRWETRRSRPCWSGSALTSATTAAPAWSIVTTFPSDEAMDQLIVMGYEQGLSTAVGQIDEVLSA